MTGCVMYPPERLTSFSRAGCLEISVWGEGAGFVAAIFGFPLPNVAPDAPDVFSDQSLTALTADATCARGGVLAVCAGAWWMPNREIITAMTAATNPFI